MKPTPRPYQESSIRDLTNAFKRYPAALDASDTGTGKTYVAAFLANILGYRPAVICPKTIIPVWREVLTSVGLDPLFVTNYEKIRRPGEFGQWAIKGKQWQWNLPEGTLLIFDEVHRCKAQKTVNSMLLTATKRCRGIKTLMLSATAADSPVDMRATGYVLGLHNLHGFASWCKDRGCKMGFRGLEFKGTDEDMVNLHLDMFPKHGVRLRKSHLPGFPKEQVSTVALDLDAKAASRFRRVEKVLEKIDAKREEDEESAAVEELRLRQEVEILKVPLLVDRTTDLLEEGNSVALFVNYRDTVDTLSSEIISKMGEGSYVSMIMGGQGDAARQGAIEMFQDNSARVCVAQIDTGGVGVSLHDLTGDYPRVTLVCPGYSANSLRQALGRTPRDGAKSKCVQNIIFAAGTVEEKVKRRVDAKLHRLDLLNDGDLDANNPEEPDKLSDTVSDRDSIPTKVSGLEKTTEPTPGVEVVSGGDNSLAFLDTEPIRFFKPSASNGKYVEECPHYRPDKFKENTYTKEGTELHGYIEHQKIPKDLDPWLAGLVQACLDFEDKFEGYDEDYAELKLNVDPSVNRGIIDRLFLYRDQAHADIIDWKMGWEPVDDPEPSEGNLGNIQGQCYVLAVFEKWSFLQTATVWFAQPKIGKIFNGTFNRSDCDKIRLRLRRLADRANNPDLPYRPGAERCSRCAASGTCPALAKTALVAAHGYTELALPKEWHSSEIDDPDQMSKARALADVMDKWVESVKFNALAMRLDAGLELPGYTLTERKGSVRITDAQAAFDALSEKYGISADDFMEIASVKWSDVKEIVRAKSARGQKQKDEEAARDLLFDADAMSEGEPTHFLRKSKEWKSLFLAP